ncbi:MAG TPA: SMC family ATPase [Ignavibacteriales bacterium]|nr:SMC family ATPase [Ignavibacteriales bacterium]
MKLLKFKLRGAIGIKKGVGLDEIEVDFAKLGPGLIALIGRSGSGKSTFMENLHPYRMMVSRNGSLKRHFFLKDSYRILEFEHEGMVYESRILIDAVTDNSEAYLFRNGIPLNDGKNTTYDEVLEEVLGSPDLFFNSVFSGQKSKGIAQLKAGERRDLFHELLNLKKYEILNDEAKKKLSKAQADLAAVESEIATLSQYQDDGLEQQLKDLEEEKAGHETNIRNKQEQIAGYQETIRTLEIEIAQLEVQIRQNEEVKAKVSQKAVEIETAVDEYNKKHGEITARKSNALKDFDRNSEYSARIDSKLKAIDSLRFEEADSLQEITENKNKLNRDLLKLESDKADTEKLITRNKRLLENRATIAENIKSKEDLNENLTEKQKEKNEKTAEVLELFRQRDSKTAEINKKKQDRQQLEHEINIISRTITEYNNKKANLIATFGREICRIEADTAILSEVPCGEVGKRCKLLTRAYEVSASIPELKEKNSMELTVLDNDIRELTNRGVERQKTIEELEKAIAADEQSLNTSIMAQIEFHQGRIAYLENVISAIRKDLDKLNEADWEKLEKEALEAEHQIELLSERLNNTSILILQTSNNIETVKQTYADKMESYRKQKEALALEITNLKEQSRKEREAKEREFDIRLGELKATHEETLQRLIKEREDLKKSMDPFLDGILSEKRENLAVTIETNVKQNWHLDNIKSQLPEIESKIATVKAWIERLKANELKIKELEPKLSACRQDVKDCTFLCRAFDKTGIPVLKLENSGVQITSIANELLSRFEKKKFRIAFETTKPTADKKKMKEVFDINVLEDDGVCEISDKSGGEQVIIETALRLAISLVVRQQGRNLKTSFLDEADGALDLDLALDYVNMIHNQHQQSGVHNTFIITHRTEIKDLIPQQIRFADGRLEVVN